MLTVIEYYT